MKRKIKYFKPTNWYEKNIILSLINKLKETKSIFLSVFYTILYIFLGLIYLGFIEISEKIKKTPIKEICNFFIKIMIEIICWIPLLYIFPSLFWLFSYYWINFKTIRPEFNISIMILLIYLSFKTSKWIRETLNEKENI